jgi:hypothetical protein
MDVVEGAFARGEYLNQNTDRGKQKMQVYTKCRFENLVGKRSI